MLHGLFRRGGYAFEGVVVADHKHNPRREDTWRCQQRQPARMASFYGMHGGGLA
jgi:hypothetical protein